MTVKEMRQALKGLPPNMQIVIPHGFDSFVTICNDRVELIGGEQDGQEETLLLLNPCICNITVDDLLDEISLN